jgi:hypothetical protein
MKKFVFLYQGWGDVEPGPEVMQAWGTWFERVGQHMVDSGNPFGTGREVTPGGARELTDETSPTTGYSIVSAADIDAAEKLLDGCPSTSVRIYESLPM